MKSLACIVGRHRWTIRVEDGESYDVCSRCGKMPQSRPTGDREFGEGFPNEIDLSPLKGEGGAGTNMGTGGM